MERISDVCSDRRPVFPPPVSEGGRRRRLSVRVALASALVLGLTVGVRAQVENAPRPDPDKIADLISHLARKAKSLTPQERQAWRQLLRMVRADQSVPYVAREVRQVAQGQDTEQWLRVNPSVGVRIEGIRPDNKIVLDTPRQAFVYQPRERKWFSRPPMLPIFRGILGEILRRVDQGELKATIDGEDTVASRPCTIIRIAPANGVSGPSHRFWIDRGTGLRLKMEVVGQDGRVFTSSYLLSLDLNPRFRSDDFTPPEGAVVAERSRRSVTFKSLAEAQQANVDVPEPRYLPNGYTLRTIEAATRDSKRPRVTLRYSNGLSVISLTRFKSDNLPERLKERLTKSAPGFLPNPKGPGERAYIWETSGNVFLLFSALPDEEVKRIADQVRP
ncbi:MAG: sigma-E factor regulatory protein RseB domain-containing protein [Capsulimonadales bacterium]|nr:sigma-E factor regulatory protein RseB domain-containing protein [Capsulimonadales bacterium]